MRLDAGAAVAAQTPAVSVIVPAYNSARTIERCLEALGRQRTAVPFEVIVVDSGDDDTPARVAGVLPWAHVIRSGRRLMPGEARNLGAAEARAGVLAFLDSDTCPDEEWVETVHRAMRSGADVVCGAIANANPGSAVSRAEELLMFNEFLTDSPRGPRWFAVSASMAVRRDVYERAGGFPDWRGAEDVVFSRRVTAQGGRIEFLPELRVEHGNRTAVRPFLRNQFLLGEFTARARRVVEFADTTSWALFVTLLPLAPLAKLAKITLRLARGNPGRLPQLVREAPLFLLGLCVFCAGMVRGALAGAPPRDHRSGRATASAAGRRYFFAPPSYHAAAERAQQADKTAEVLVQAGFASARRVLDVGCGAGVTLGIVRRLNPQAALVGVDPDREAVRQAIYAVGDVAVIVGSGEELPVGTGSVDHVICRVAINYMRQEPTARELKRVVASTGCLVVLCIRSGFYWKQAVGARPRVPGLRARLRALKDVVAGLGLQVLGVQGAAGSFWGRSAPYTSPGRLRRQLGCGPTDVVWIDHEARFLGLATVSWAIVRTPASRVS
jgi:GT2 family glycosyltransferase/SAM-dependent methyltransferase